MTRDMIFVWNHTRIWICLISLHMASHHHTQDDIKRSEITISAEYPSISCSIYSYPYMDIRTCSQMMTAASHSRAIRLKYVVPIESKGGGGPVGYELWSRAVWFHKPCMRLVWVMRCHPWWIFIEITGTCWESMAYDVAYIVISCVLWIHTGVWFHTFYMIS